MCKCVFCENLIFQFNIVVQQQYTNRQLQQRRYATAVAAWQQPQMQPTHRNKFKYRNQNRLPVRHAGKRVSNVNRRLA